MKAFLFCILIAFGPDKNLLVYRELMVQAEKSADAAKIFMQLTSDAGEKNYTVQGYNAMAHFMMCKHESNPFTKISQFNSGKKLLDKAIGGAPANIELRYLRFTVQCNAPSFLGYDDQLTEDKKLILDYLKNKNMDDTDLYERIFSFVTSSDKISASDKKLIK